MPDGGVELLEEHTVSEAMTPSPVHSLPDTFVTMAADYMRRAKSIVPVMTGTKLVGLVTTSDITDAVADA